MRIKHSVNGNSVKLYDKTFVLRAETTIHRGGEFRVYRRKEGDSKGKKSWCVLRGGVADLHRRAEISERAAERYLDALAGVDEQTTLQELLDRLGQPKQWKGRRARALHLSGDIGAQSTKQPRPRTVICIRTPIFFNFRRLNRKD